MQTYELADKISFLLKDGYIFNREVKDSGDVVYKILSGVDTNDAGETTYKFSSNVSCTRGISGSDGYITNQNFLDDWAKNMEASRIIPLPGTPSAIFASIRIPYSEFDDELKIFGIVLLIQTGDWDGLAISSVSRVQDDDEANLEIYTNMYELAQSIRIEDKMLQLDGISPEAIRDALAIDFEEALYDEFTASTTRTEGASEEDIVTYDYISKDGTMRTFEFSRAIPGLDLYPHYASLVAQKDSLANSIAGRSGKVKFVINESGTEKSFQAISSADKFSDTYDEMEPVYNRTIASDTGNYDLHIKARKMQSLFRVNESVFDPRRDREGDIEEGFLHRAYMLCGLRSFAWTLADYCDKHGLLPEDLDFITAYYIVSFIAKNDWLNYDGDSYCQGLCSGSDLHVYYIPEAVSNSDRKKLLPDYDVSISEKIMIAMYPQLNQIPEEVHSLDALRMDLAYIYPVVQILWDHLEEDRNYNEPLTGNIADIVYAWCSLALAAREPFFSEDGPMTWRFRQLTDRDREMAKEEDEAADRAKNAGKYWLEEYGHHIQHNPQIKFDGSKFVFTGLGGGWSEKDHPAVQKVINKGGIYRTTVSGVTDYLVVDPDNAGHSKILSVLEQWEKGKKIKVILLEDLERALEEEVIVQEESTPLHRSEKELLKQVETSLAGERTKPTDTSTSVRGVKVPKSDCEIDKNGTLIKYHGFESEIILPDGIRKVGQDAFFNNDTLESVVIPEGVISIEDDAFWISTALNNVVLPGTLKKIGNNAFRNCDELTSIIIPEGVKEIGDEVFSSSRKLKDIYVPASVTEFGTYAFDTFCPDMVIHLVKGSVAESYCKDNEWKYDYKTVQRTVFSVEGVADDLQDDTAIVYKISDEVKFILPPDITFEHDVDEEGSESYKILSGKYKDDEENTQYEYRVSVSISSSKDDDSSPQTIIKNISESSGILKLMGSRPAVFTSPPLGDIKTLSFFGQTMTVVAINLFVWTDLGDRVNLLSFDTIIGDIGEKIGPICENLIRVSQTLRVNGEPLDLTNVSVDSMRKKLQLVPSDGDGVANVEPLFFDALEKSDLDSELKDTLTETPEKPKHVGKATELWLDKYCEYVESNPEIEINGKKFVFSGLTTRSQEKNHRIVNKLTFHGGQHRLSVSSVTDYLVVNPDKASESEIKSVIEQRDKGKQIKVILLEDLEKALEVKSSKLTGHDYAGVPSYYVAATDDDFIEDEDGETFRYIGNHEYVIIPYVINGKEITSYRRMFEEAYSLEGIYRTNLKGVASLNTNVTDMSGMFDGRRGITELDLRYLDTSNVESMYFMFGNCNSLTSLDLSNFNTSKVTDMSFMFNFCSELTILDLSSFNTSEVRSMSYMFLRCSSLTSLNLSSLTTPSIFDMENMFEDCTSLEVLDLSTFELFELPEYNCMDNMFKNCTSLTTVFVRTEKDANFLNKTNSERINYVDKVSGKVYNKDNLSRKYSESSSDESSFSPTSNQQANPWEQPLKPPESNKQGACYIATAVYGSYDASQVLILRNFRDHTLSNSAAGRWFIRTYYKLSPPVAERLKKAKRLNRMVRSVLDKLVQHLNSKELTKRT